MDIHRGSGTYVGIHVLARSLAALGHHVHFETPQHAWPNYTLQRLAFNASLRQSNTFDVTVGFDMDGYRIANAPRHVASLKGVIADEVRFEHGWTRRTMGVQARCEQLHCRRASRVLATSAYSAARAANLYGLKDKPAIVPELIELEAWRGLLAGNPAPARRCFTLLYVGRFYRRKRVDLLLRAAAAYRNSGGRDLELRIVGDGPCNASWRALARDLKLDGVVTWLGDVTRAQLAQEYNGADAFCLPSVQEGFGIVLLEAMAASKPIVAARAAAIPEVAPHAVLVEPDSVESLRAGIERVRSAAPAHPEWVAQFDARLVAMRFLDAVRPTLVAAAP